MLMKCVVCESPTAKSKHFGARTCKACAAFFRRAVALSVVYECTGDRKGECEIHHEKRLMCKHCRYNKCIAKNMQSRMVQSQKEGHIKSSLKKKRKLKNRKEKEGKNSSSFDSDCSDMDETDATRREHFSPNPVYSLTDDEVDALCKIYYQVESDHNVRRMVTFTKRPIKYAFNEEYCACPYTKEDLIEFDFTKYAGPTSYEFAQYIDLTKNLPGAADLCPRDRNLLFRYLIGVDLNVNSGLYTSLLGIHEGMLVTQDRFFYNMIPLPISGNDPECETMFNGDQVIIQKYKMVFGQKRRLWTNVVIPYCKLNFSYEEHCLVKFLAAWQLVFYLFNEDGLKIYERESKKLLRCLHRLCMRNNNGELRFGHLLMFLSIIFEGVNELSVYLHMLNIFHRDPVCPNLGELLNFDTA